LGIPSRVPPAQSGFIVISNTIIYGKVSGKLFLAEQANQKSELQEGFKGRNIPFQVEWLTEAKTNIRK